MRRWSVVALASVAVASSDAADEGMSVNLGSEQVSQTWSLGDHRARLDITLARSARLWMAGNRVWISLNATHPELAAKLQASFRSTAKSGYTLIAKSGSTEVSLGSVRAISLSTDAEKVVWVHAMIRLQQRSAGVASTSERPLTAKLEPSVAGHVLIFTLKSFQIEGLTDAMNRSIAQRIPPMRIELPDCAEGVRFETVRFSEKENAVNLTASVSGSDLFSLLPCLTGLD